MIKYSALFASMLAILSFPAAAFAYAEPYAEPWYLNEWLHLGVVMLGGVLICGVTLMMVLRINGNKDKS